MNSISRSLIKSVLKGTISQKARLVSCWSCGTESPKLVSDLFCPNCKSLQKPKKGGNYFNVLRVNETYDLDANDLSKRYKDLQRFLHPDKFASRDKKELEISESFSSLVNEAYKTLLDPLTRGIYMLRLRGLDIPEKTEVDKEFLMKIMEINEEVEEAATEKDIMKLNERNKIVLEELTKLVSKAFLDGDMKRVIWCLGRLKYYTSIENQIQSVIRRKGIIR